MIKEIHSKLNPSILLNIFYFNEKLSEDNSVNRVDITPPETFLQASHITLNKDIIIKPHKHNLQIRETNKTHEALIVLKGSVTISIYDLDNSLVETFNLKNGDCSILLNGGHSIKCTEKSEILELKNGPYFGPDKDRTYLNP